VPKEYRETFTMIHEILLIYQEKEATKSKIGRVANLGGLMTKFYVEKLLELNYLEGTESGKRYGHGEVMNYKTTARGMNFKYQISDWVELSKKSGNTSIQTSRNV